MIIFILLMISFNLSANYAHPITPTYFKYLQLDNSMFGLAFAFMSLGMFISSPFWGKMNKVIHSKTSMAIGCIGYSVGQLLFMLLHNPILILIARFIAGLSCGAFFVGSLTYIVNLATNEKRRTLLTINATTQTVAGAGGYFIGGMLGEINIYLAFIIQIIQLLLTGILSYFLLKEDASLNTINVKEIIKDSNPFHAFKSAKVFMNKSFLLLFIMTTFIFFGYTSLDQTFNYYLKDVFMLTSGYNGIIKGVIGIISLIVNMSIGLYIMKNTNIKISQIYLLLLSSIIICISLLMNKIIWFISCIMLFYAIYAIIVPLGQDIITNESKENKSIVLGFYQSIKSLGMILGAYVAGIVYNIKPTFPFIIALILYICAFILSIYWRKNYE